MIKIFINDIENKKLDYVHHIKPLVTTRINHLISALTQLNDSTQIDCETDGFVSIKAILKSIINIAEGRQYAIDINKRDYNANLFAYVDGPNNLHVIDIDTILDFLRHLLNHGGAMLETLLICPPERLTTLNDTLLDDNNVRNAVSMNILKLAFDYDASFEGITDAVKGYFRHHNFVRTCPYCNLVEVYYRPGDDNKPATTHQLDHFYDKATYFLLSYSMFNLIPCDSTCNTINKLQTPFLDEHNLNPHIDGFCTDFSFVPVYISNGKKISVSQINIEFHANVDDIRKAKLVGPNLILDEHDKRGNINVFKLKSKYKDRTKEAARILEQVTVVGNGLGSLKKFMSAMSTVNRRRNYATWYLNTFHTSFEYDSFNENSFSKFNRDIHDCFYNRHPTRVNKYVRDLILDQ